MLKQVLLASYSLFKQHVNYPLHLQLKVSRAEQCCLVSAEGELVTGGSVYKQHLLRIDE